MSIDVIGLERNGYSFTHGVCQTGLIDTVQKLGPIRVDQRSPDPVRDIRPQPISLAKTNTLSSRYGTEAFPFHTDTAHWDQPARFLALYCVNPGAGKRPTLLQDSYGWRFDEHAEDLACRALWKTGHVQPRLCTVAERSKRGRAIRAHALAIDLPPVANGHHQHRESIVLDGGDDADVADAITPQPFVVAG